MIPGGNPRGWVSNVSALCLQIFIYNEFRINDTSTLNVLSLKNPFI